MDEFYITVGKLPTEPRKYSKTEHDLLDEINTLVGNDILGKKLHQRYRELVDMKALSTPAVGMMYMDPETMTICVWDGDVWIETKKRQDWL